MGGCSGPFVLLQTSQPSHQLGHDRGRPLSRRGTRHCPAERQRGNDFRAVNRASRQPRGRISVARQRLRECLPAWFRCQPIVADNSPRIRPFRGLPARLHRVAFAFVTARDRAIVSPAIRGQPSEPTSPAQRPGRSRKYTPRPPWLVLAADRPNAQDRRRRRDQGSTAWHRRPASAWIPRQLAPGGRTTRRRTGQSAVCRGRTRWRG